MTAPRILVLNAGSSSLKASVIEPPDTTIATAEVELDGAAREEVVAALDRLIGAHAELGVGDDIDAVGHRVVHGGADHRATVRIDDEVIAAIDEAREIAPLHNLAAIGTIAAARTRFGDVPHLAAFDSAFHRTLPPEAFRYALPERWFRDLGIRRFGFHGLSVAWSLRRCAELLGRDAGDLSIVVAHLGSGCSVTAVKAGESVATSMGYTPLEGLMMASRSGSIDPAIPTHIVAHGDLSPVEVARRLERSSGLLGVSGVSADMRAVQAAADDGDERARLAIAMFCRSAAAGIAAQATALPRLDALVFTGGIGEHAVEVRRDIVARLGVLGIAPLEGDGSLEGDGWLTPDGIAPGVLRIEAREDLVIAAETAALLET